MTHVQEKKHLQHMAQRLCKQTYFSKSEIEMLQKYYSNRFGKGKLDRNKFRDFILTMGITDDTMMDRVFKVFDANNDGYVCMEEWIQGVAIWLKGSEEQQWKYTFDVYDMGREGNIRREDMFTILKKAEIKSQADEDPEEAIRDLVDIVFKVLSPPQSKVTQGATNKISQEDFYNACKQDTLHVEILGQCIPAKTKRDELKSEMFCQ